MNEIDELLQALREKPGLYIGRKSLKLLTAFVTGYIHCVYIREGICLKFLPGFQEFIEKKYGYYCGLGWSQIIEIYSVYEETAFDKFFELLDEFKTVSQNCLEETSVRIIDSNISCIDIVKNIISYDMIRVSLRWDSSLTGFIKKINAECVKKIESGYYVPISTNRGWVIVFFDNNQRFLYVQPIKISEKMNKEQMDNIREGMSLEEVKMIDKEGDYSFTYTNWLQYSKMSYHYLPDGHTYVISYDDELCINHIHTFIL